MDIYIFELQGQYAGGLALVSAPSKQEAASCLANVEHNSYQVEEFVYDTDDNYGDLVHPSNESLTVSTDRKWVIVNIIPTSEPYGVVAMSSYAE